LLTIPRLIPYALPMPPNAVRFTGLTAFLCLVLAIAAYFLALGSDHAATNGDELLYAQITRLTADTGQWLPLQSEVERHRNTKPPALFWQGIVSTDWATHYELWRLRYPSVLYTLGIAALVFLIGRKLGGTASLGLLAALVYLAFFGTYRYGRVFLTSAPETFWLFLPFGLLLLRKRPLAPIGWGWATAFGLMFGLAMLYKSFALAVPGAAGLAWWTLHAQNYRIAGWLKHDAPQIALAGLLSLGVFSLWYFLDPQRHLILADFVLDENVGKFNTEGESYFANLLWGGSSIWRNVVSYPVNAGLLAPAVLAVFVFGFLRRKQMDSNEKLLWLWLITLFVVFALPNQRDERYLLPGMPALAVLCALYWTRIPSWLFGLSLVAIAVIALGMGWGGLLLTRDLAEGPLYPWYFWVFLALLIGFVVFALVRRSAIRSTVVPAILLLYLAFALFLIPFDGPRGAFDLPAQELARGKAFPAPVNFGAREEIYRFLLPGANPRPYKLRKAPGIDELRDANELFIVTVPLRDRSVEADPRLRVVGSRLQLIDRFNNAETMDMLRGNASRSLFKEDLLVEVKP
jgi:4-amino-4-deoxy-L-arabinose transferase-like glycosyltransferase